MADLDLVIKGGTVATSGGAVECDVGVRDGRVAVLADDIAADGAEVIDARARIVMPGGVDSHCHIAAAGPDRGRLHVVQDLHLASPNQPDKGRITTCQASLEPDLC